MTHHREKRACNRHGTHRIIVNNQKCNSCTSHSCQNYLRLCLRKLPLYTRRNPSSKAHRESDAKGIAERVVV